jgi:TIR domain
MDPKSPSIFLSHAHEDKPFVRYLARQLTSHGVRVWIDEAEMGVGDSLLEKITASIAEMDYLGVVISQHSGQSDWVTREVEIAMRESTAGEQVKVLPLLLRGGTLPPNLAGTIHADFTSETMYEDSLRRVLLRLGVGKADPDSDSDRLLELASSSGLLRSALAELRGNGISNATADALVSARIADVELSEFLSLVARELQGQQMFGLAISLIPYIDQRGVGQEALDFCLNSGRLEDWQVAYVGMHMQYVETPAGVRWCHSRLTSLIRSDAYYHSFLFRHIDLVVAELYDEMAAYLLHPNRGPANYNIDSFTLVISHTDDPTPFQRRWMEWINDGYFDRGDKEGGTSARLLYVILNEFWGDARFSEIVEVIESRVHLLLKTGSQDEFRGGMYHLVAMVNAKYRGVDRVLERTVERVYDLGGEDGHLFELIRGGLEAVAAYNLDPSDKERERLITSRYLAIADADRRGITGYWRSDDE